MLYTLCFLLLFVLILAHAPEAAAYAADGFLLWYSKMVPSLLPFMILSGLMIRTGLSRQLGRWLQPLLGPLLRCRPEVHYGVAMGFLCGFPMGARTAAQLYKAGKINREEARFLLAFCNNIGPAYFCGFVLPLLGLRPALPYLAGMYGVAFLYGIILRWTMFRTLPCACTHEIKYRVKPADLLASLDDAVQAGLQGIISLCGYMVLFNLLNLVPRLFLPEASPWLSPLLEITGGLQQLGRRSPLYSLLLLPFGGLSCIAQTYGMIRGTDLALGEYVVHKLLLTGATGLYYLAYLAWGGRLAPHFFLLR